MWRSLEVDCVIETVKIKDKKIKCIKWSTELTEGKLVIKKWSCEEEMRDLGPSGWDKETKDESEHCCKCSWRLQQAQGHNIKVEQDASFLNHFPQG